jgi:hypothetical protein
VNNYEPQIPHGSGSEVDAHSYTLKISNFKYHHELMNVWFTIISASQQQSGSQPDTVQTWFQSHRIPCCFLVVKTALEQAISDDSVFSCQYHFTEAPLSYIMVD